jgi:hypothetical protein
VTGSWDEQPVCRNCTGTTSLTGSPNFVWFSSPESDGHGEFSPQRIQQVKWTSPVTSKLLLEAGFGTTYYEWGGKQLEDTSTENLVQMLNLSQAITPTFSTAMRYRSQFWLNNKTRGSQFNASASYITGSHSLKFGYQGAYWRTIASSTSTARAWATSACRFRASRSSRSRSTSTSTRSSSMRGPCRRRSSSRTAGR